MRKPKWQAKVFYLIIALAFAIGLAPLAAAPTPVLAAVHADFYAYPMDYAKAGQIVDFRDMSADGAAPTGWLWDFGDGSTSTDQSPSHQYYPTNNPGCETYDVTLTATWPSGATDTVTKEDYITVCWGLITEPLSLSYDGYSYYAPSGIDSQIGYNVLKAKAIFWVPDAWADRVIAWHVLGDGYVVAGGSTSTGLPGYPWDPDGLELPLKMCWIQVQSATEVGEVLISADIDLSGPPETADFTLYATKKWGDINYTELDIIEGYDYETGEWVYSPCPGESEVVWYEGCTYITIPEWLGGGEIERCKGHFGYGLLRERVIGTFEDKLGGTFEHPANGAIVHMFLLDSSAPVHALPQTEQEAFDGDWSATRLLNEVIRLQDLYPPRCVSFYDGDPIEVDDNGNLIHVTKLSGSIDLNGNGVFEDPDEMGLTGNMLMAECEEAVKIVFVATYPYEQGPELPVFAEICAWNFWTQQLEKVPQVHWAGEKKVLEKQFGSIYAGYPVIFNLENQSCGSLFPVQVGYAASGGGAMGSQQVSTTCDQYGVARAILESQSPCEVDIQCSLYDYSGRMINQAGWVVFFLKFEGLTLSNMQGQRTGHDSGLWDPIVDSGMVYDAYPNDIFDPTKDWDPDRFAGKTVKVWKGEMEEDGSITFIGDLQIREILTNGSDTVVVTVNWAQTPSGPTEDVQWYYQIIDPVWDPATDDLEQELNVSQDALLRARVKGWFMGDDLSIRDASYCDVNGNGVKDMADYVLPAGRWVLPDDWEYLAGPEWEELRPHWDIMDQPNDNIMSDVDTDLDKFEELGPYFEWTLNERPNRLDVPGDLVADFPVIGPFSELDTYTPYIEHPWKLNYKTIIPNGKLNWWDCPMPPAKIVFKITDGAGYFKEVNKGHVYYQWVETDLEGSIEGPDIEGPDGIVYTNPYYWTMIPASPLIPPFNLNGGYDWDSWNSNYGPYPFWKIFNQLPGDTLYDPQHPTKVEVYSDNHGEAMVWLNGDWNLDLSDWVSNGAFDVPTGAVVADTVVKAIADYPYMRKHPAVVSSPVHKIWTWGKQILGADYHRFNDYSWDYDPYDPVNDYNPRMVFQVGTLLPDGTSDKKMAFIWVCDRDGNPPVGEEINWFLAPPGAEIPPISTNGNGVSIYLPDIDVKDGLLVGTTISPTGKVGGVSPDRQRAISFARLPTEAEKDLFRKFQGFGLYPADLDPDDYAVAAIEVLSSLPVAFDLTIYLHEREGTVIRHTNLNFNVADAWDDPYVSTFKTGDVQLNGVVDVLDMIKVGQKFGMTGLPGWILEDVNKDGAINVLDMILVGQNLD
jgi:PKD repeat protein